MDARVSPGRARGAALPVPFLEPLPVPFPVPLPVPFPERFPEPFPVRFPVPLPVPFPVRFRCRSRSGSRSRSRCGSIVPLPRKAGAGAGRAAGRGRPGPGAQSPAGSVVSRRDGAGGGAGLGAVAAVAGPGGAQPALRCTAASEPGAAGQHPQRSAAHHHPHGHLCLPARPAAVAERDPPGHRENAASHPVLPPGIRHPSIASALPVLPSGTHRPGAAAPDPAGSPLRYPPCHRCSGPARFSRPLPAAAGDALRMRAWLSPHLCPCCIPWLHRDVASSGALAGCWKSSSSSSANRTPGAPGACSQRSRLARSRG